ncbi:unnamed protein product [marine sediment metagenome]|uniref:D,D-heptose 1,7-bisphosphate phosphatase n=1 Tax=marine sediment metagenome TaxID=412755 RepID=X1K2X5_9ZZZZ
MLGAIFINSLASLTISSVFNPITSAQQQHNIDLISSYMVGDTLNDIQTGNAVRCKTVLVLTGYGKEEKKKIQSIIPDKIFKNLKEFAISI